MLLFAARLLGRPSGQPKFQIKKEMGYPGRQHAFRPGGRTEAARWSNGFPFPLPRLLPPSPPAQLRTHAFQFFPQLFIPPLLFPLFSLPTHLRIPTSEPSALAASNPPTPARRGREGGVGIRKATRADRWEARREIVRSLPRSRAAAGGRC
jgi:hypothetical protein